MLYNTLHFKKGWLNPGDLITKQGYLYIVYNSKRDDNKIVSAIQRIDTDLIALDAIENYSYNIEDNLSIIGKAYLNPQTRQYQHRKLDDCESYGITPLDYSDKLSTDNPLSSLPYWNAPGGKNLTIIHALEWALLHLTNEQAKLPCEENESTIEALKIAIEKQQDRRRRRSEQGVLGTKNPHKSSK